MKKILTLALVVCIIISLGITGYAATYVYKGPNGSSLEYSSIITDKAYSNGILNMQFNKVNMSNYPSSMSFGPASYTGKANLLVYSGRSSLLTLKSGLNNGKQFKPVIVLTKDGKSITINGVKYTR